MAYRSVGRWQVYESERVRRSLGRYRLWLILVCCVAMVSQKTRPSEVVYVRARVSKIAKYLELISPDSGVLVTE